MSVRDLLLLGYFGVWALVVGITAWSTRGQVPAELWAALGVGEGALMALFRGDDALRHRANSASLSGRPANWISWPAPLITIRDAAIRSARPTGCT